MSFFDDDDDDDNRLFAYWTRAARALPLPSATNAVVAADAPAERAAFGASVQAAPQAGSDAPAPVIGFSPQGPGFGNSPALMAHSGISEADVAVVMGEGRVSRVVAVAALLMHG